MRRFGCLAMLMIVGMASSAALAAPPTLDHPGKKIRFISLAEARAIALEQGTIGQPRLLFPGIGLDNSLTGPQSESTTHVRIRSKAGSKCLLLTGAPRGPRAAEFERNVNQLLLNIEVAYWNLYGSYWQLHSREQALRFAYETWKIAQEKYEEGEIGRAGVAQAEGQYNLFRSQRLEALDTVLDNERQLRAMMGWPIGEGERVVPSDAPTVVEKKPDWKEGLRTAMKKRPELRMARHDIELALDQWLTAVAGRFQLRMARHDSDSELAAWMARHGIKLAAWKVGKKEAPVRSEQTSEDAKPSDAELRQAELQLKRARQVLKDQEVKAAGILGLYFRRMSSAYFQIKAARAQREAFARQLDARFESYKTGAEDASLNLLLEAQRFWAEALATEYQAIVTHNNALAAWEFSKGTIRKHAHVRFGKEPPEGSQSVPAVEREHKRKRWHVRREPALEADSPLAVLDACGTGSKATAPSLPALWKSFPPLKEAGDLETGLVEGRVFD